MKWILYICCLYAASAPAADYVGKVVAVTDGDTLKILTAEREQLTVRLTSIDAPERAQPYGSRSKEALSSICFNNYAEIDSPGKDRYGRILGRVYCEDVDANAEMIRRGMAWVYTRYNDDPALVDYEYKAMQAKTGLWHDADPVPPWEWRKQKPITQLP